MAPINWNSPAELAKISSIYAAFVLVLAGVGTWDVLSTLAFDWSIVSGKRKWRWPMLLYFVDRFAMLIHIYAYCVNLNAISYIDCDTVVWMSKITDMIGTCTSSAILALRTTAVWRQKRTVTIPLALASAVQIILWGQTMRYSKSIWNAQRGVCQIIQTSPVPLLVGVWSYTMTYDFAILCLCSFKLWRARGQGGIAGLLLRDGIGYFAATFLTNLVQVILASLALNPIMNIIAVPFTLVVSVIAATTVFRHVFTMYDDFSSETSPHNTKSNSNFNSNSGGAAGVATIGGTNRSNRTRGSKPRHEENDSFALSSVKSSTNVMTGIEIHKVIDVEQEAASRVALPYDHRKNRGVESNDDDDASFRDEKKRMT
ncbi:hypothetical protein FRB94_009045 [Tulasnella sp. JGI-2019a]|nr:hypothetical protein FRB94_009045 [Tulasnella sp. JGI-2019a]